MRDLAFVVLARILLFRFAEILFLHHIAPVFHLYSFFFLLFKMNYWLVKSEPVKYSWETFQKDGRAVWDGVRNYQARNNLQAMKTDDRVLYYHSNEGKEIVGIARVVREAYPDPTADDPTWVVVDLVPEQKFARPVTLEQIKANDKLNQIALIRQSRLSVMPIKPEEFDVIVGLGTE
jgi:predicted RNA-binding protein with PUA-like domain